MSYTIEDIEGIGPANAAKLAVADIRDTADLLEKCGTAKGREYVSKATGVSTQVLLRWTNIADLMRISGVGSEYSELLEAAGVDTVKELRNRRADNLAAKLAEINAQRMLTRAVPTATRVEKWIDQARGLPPVISH